MTEKRYEVQYDGYQYFCVVDVPNEAVVARLDTKHDALAWLEIYEMLLDENKELRLTLKEHQKYIEEQHNENIKLKGELKNLRRLANEIYMEGSE